jgi:penicillin-binding protein 1C
MAAEIGVPTVARLLRRAGVTSLDQSAAHYGLGLTLGNAEVRLDELVAAYATLARGGESVAPRRVLEVDGKTTGTSTVERIMSERTAFWVTDILSDADARSFAFGRGGRLEFPFPVAAKTGTSQSYFDNWVVGYTRDVTVGVWVGNFDRTPLRGSSGITGAGPIFHAVMLAAVEYARGTLPIGDVRPVHEPTADVERREICALSGMAAGAACPTRVAEWLPRGHDHAACTWHHDSDRGLITIWPEEYHDWARQSGIAIPAAVPPPSAVVAAGMGRTAGMDSRTGAPGDDRRLTIVRPVAGAVFMLDSTLRPEFQALTLAARGGRAPLQWTVNGNAVPPDATGISARWPLARGRHDVVVRDAAGQTATTRIEVR